MITDKATASVRPTFNVEQGLCGMPINRPQVKYQKARSPLARCLAHTFGFCPIGRDTQFPTFPIESGRGNSINAVYRARLSQLSVVGSFGNLDGEL